MSNSADYDQLIERIKTLEIDNKQLKLEVKELKRDIQKGKPAASEQLRVNSRETRLDRTGKPIELGDFVYIVTPGAFTHISRQGTVTGFEDYRDWVFVKDEANNLQVCAAKNLKILKKSSQKK